jgi:hypothetical protein
MAKVWRIDGEGNKVTPKQRALKAVRYTIPAGDKTLRIFEDGSGNQFITSIIAVGLFDYSFSRIIDNYYRGWIGVLNDYKRVQIEALLPAHVVTNIDFSLPIYIDKLAAWFYVDSIENHRIGRPCKVTLQRI